MDLLEQLGIQLVNVTAGSPYYNPHFQRPAHLPALRRLPAAGRPARRRRAARSTSSAELKAAFPKLVSSAPATPTSRSSSPHVAQAAVREGVVDFVGIGRMVLCYPELPADTLAGRPLQRKRICRTFSDCTTAPAQRPRLRLLPARPAYKQSPLRKELLQIKAAGRCRA